MKRTDNPSAIYTVRTSRTARRCEAGCGRVIAPGERYSRAALPPWKDVNASDSWWKLDLCADCRATTEPEDTP